jgi:predicted MFS family arabinose efflux permease
MAGCSAVGAIFALAVPVVQESVWLFYAVLFFWGGAIGGIYTAGLTVLGNRFKGAALAAANTAFVFSYALGAVAGPLGAGLVRGSLGPEALIVMIALVLGLYAWAARRRGAAA